MEWRAMWVVLVLALAAPLLAQTPGSLPINGSLRVDGGNLDGCRVTVMKDGEKHRSITSGLNRFSMDLELGADYVLSFEKPGFVTKKVSFNTNVPMSSSFRNFMPFDFIVTIFPQYDGVDIVAFDQPVGRVHYDDRLGDFDYDTDYSKSVKRQQEEAQAKLDRKQKQAERDQDKREKKPDPPAQTEKPPVERPAPQPPVEATASPPKEPVVHERSKPVPAAPVHVAHLADANVGQVPKPKFSSPPVAATRTTDVIVGKNEVVTVIQVQRGEERNEYRRVARKYSGTYYFKNGRSISQFLYEREALADN